LERFGQKSKKCAQINKAAHILLFCPKHKQSYADADVCMYVFVYIRFQFVYITHNIPALLHTNIM
jgi:hypothetical protein